MQIEFAGADREVTGSCHIIRVNDKTVLLDCGLFPRTSEQCGSEKSSSPLSDRRDRTP